MVSLYYPQNLNSTFLQVGVIRPYVTSDNQSCWKCKQRENQVCKGGKTIKSTFEPQEVEAEPVKIDSVQAALGDMRTRWWHFCSGIYLSIQYLGW